MDSASDASSRSATPAARTTRARPAAEQRRHAVGVDLQQPLHQPAEPAHAVLQQHHARPSRREIGQHGAVPVGHGGAHQRVLAQDQARERAGAGRARAAPTGAAREALARQRRQPVLRHRLHRGEGLRSPKPAPSKGREKVQVTNSVCSSQRRRKPPRSMPQWLLCASGSGRWWSRSSAARCARLASRAAASPNMTTCDRASGAAIASGRRAWISLCSTTLCGRWSGPCADCGARKRAPGGRLLVSQGPPCGHSSTKASSRLLFTAGKATMMISSKAAASRPADSGRVTSTLQSPRDSSSARRRFLPSSAPG